MAVKDKMNGSKTSQPLALEFDGEVEFEFDVKQTASFGDVHIHSKFKRLKPNLERKQVDIEDIKRLQLRLINWVSQNIDIKGKEDYFNELTTATIRFTAYVNPFSELDGKPMEIFQQILFWLWFTDDELENTIEIGIPFQSLQRGCEQLEQILKGTYDNGLLKFQSVPNYPFFDQLFHSLLDFHRICSRDLPDYRNLIGPSRFLLHRFFEAHRWFCCDVIDHRYSEASFLTWRKIVVYFDGIAEIIALVEGINLPHNVRTSPSFQRMLDIANSYGAFVNDLLGMNKEFQNDEQDNFIVFKSLQKDIPIQQVVTEVCNLMNTELEDFFLIKRVVLKEFSNEPSLVKYVEILESMIDGHIRMYLESTRHRSVGCVKLSRK